LDKNHIINKPEEYQEKVASGRVGVFLPSFDVNAVRQNLKEEGSDFRVLPWPTDTEENTIDPSYPGGFENIMINKDFKDIERLLRYFDWFQSEEAMDLLSWGPESGGLWEIKDEKKVLKNNELWEAIRDGKKTSDMKDAEYYGIACTSKAALTAPSILYNMKSIERSYPIKMNAYQKSNIYVSTEKLNRDGTVLPNAGEKSGVLAGYYWSTVKSVKIAQLLSTKSDQEFDKVWEEILYM